MLIDGIWLIVGLVLILVGANMLTDGAASLARRWGMSDLVVGLTVVAFGTSAPELVISVMSAASGNAGIAIGNVVGSNIFNIFVIVGITALLRPIVIEKTLLTKDIPLVVIASIALLAMGNAPLLEGAPSRILDRVDGIVLLLFFLIFMRHTFSQASEVSQSENLPEAEEGNAKIEMGIWKSLLWVALGLAGLIYGGDRFVDGASGLASGFGVSDAIIGLTIVAAGTSLPELATSVAAALKGKPGIAIGNVIGSNLFNIFMVLGVSGTIRPLPFGNVDNLDLLTMTSAALLFWAFGWWFKERTITRVEGGFLAVCYAAYITVRLMML